MLIEIIDDSITFTGENFAEAVYLEHLSKDNYYPDSARATLIRELLHDGRLVVRTK